jgi:hypothetical protein
MCILFLEPERSCVSWEIRVLPAKNNIMHSVLNRSIYKDDAALKCTLSDGEGKDNIGNNGEEIIQ